jgi:hypothetical protein
VAAPYVPLPEAVALRSAILNVTLPAVKLCKPFISSTLNDVGIAVEIVIAILDL